MKLTINGRPLDVSADAATPLLWVLRDELGLNGTKYGCGEGLCGACTVQIDGVAMRSCKELIGGLAGKRITTIEGLSSADGTKLHAVQQAWLECDVVQCGYCQSGQMMSAAALLQKTPRPNHEQVNEAMAGHLCRCGTYERIRAGVQRAAELIAGGSSSKGVQ